ncbi:uncharacterized protein LOC123664741 [Melitaea cinxia]|uniref:uncharacterized protein LOC123664741 n=1 Tax=Melitaea cinxia TaxID=113334 RepID=UPI001E26FB6E|nr:uncharacterized protein LOC123664741 [Melitaea cinxia]
MDNQEKSENNGEESRKEEINDGNKKVTNKPITQVLDDAGPSRVINLPGAVPHCLKNNTRLKPGVSKSEHSIRQIITTKDVANALRLTSLSYATNQTQIADLTELKIPILDKNDTENDDITLVELKRFMASCFKLNKDAPVVNETSNLNVHAAISTITNDLVQNIPEVSLTANERNFNKTIVNSTDHKQQAVDKNKNKNSDSLSEKSDFGVTQRDSLSSIGSNVCRICMTRGKERLISPCNCKGSLANVHLSCLQRWLNQMGRNHCELCGYSYPAIRTPRYTVLQALRLWFCNPRNRSHLQSDCLIFWLLSTVTAGLLAVCIVGTQYFVIEGNNFGKPDAVRKSEGISHRITETAMDFFMAIVLCGYSVTVYFLWKDHYVMWNRWRRANVNVQLLLTPDSNPVPFLPRTRYNVV